MTSIDTIHKLLLQSQQLPLSTPVVSKTNQLGDLKSFYSGSFVPEFVENYVQRLTTQQKAEWDDTVLTVYSAKGYKRFNTYIKDIQHAQNFLKCLGIVPHKVVINIIYIPGYKKEVKCENCILSPNEVNSGFYSMGTIWIYRSQELLKTTIHEMCHAYDIDSTRFHTIERRYIPSLLNVKVGKNHPNGEICLTEGVVDFVACLTMACLRAAQPISKESLSNSLKLQATHILNQAEKILCVLSKTGIIEDTHTYAYYVVKGILFGDLHASITFFQTNGWYVNTRESLERFLKFLVFKYHFKLPPATCMIASKSLRMNVFE